MKGKRFGEERIIGVLKENEAGAKVDDLCRRHGISTTTLYAWRKRCGGLEVSEVRRLRQPESIEAELEEVKKQLGRVWHFISDSIHVAAASDHNVELRERKENLESAADEARAVLVERRQYLDSADTIAAFAEGMSEFLTTSELTETKAFDHSSSRRYRSSLEEPLSSTRYLRRMTPLGGADSAGIALNGGVRKSVRHGGACRTRTGDLSLAKRALSQLS